jgi:hypothetical protein
MKPAIDVAVTQCFEGPRHTRLRNIWEAIAEFCSPAMRFGVLKHNGSLSHAESFKRIYDREREVTDCDFLLLTEEDFLPNLNLRCVDWTNRSHIGGHQAVATSYATRDPITRIAKFHPQKCGGWFVLLNKPACPPTLRFEGVPDPCNQLSKQLDVLVRKGKDGYPTHYGLDYDFGSHLFWSRHLNDHPYLSIGGFKLHDILFRHDKFVTNWIQKQPMRFREILLQRFGPKILHHRHASDQV